MAEQWRKNKKMQANGERRTETQDNVLNTHEISTDQASWYFIIANFFPLLMGKFLF